MPQDALARMTAAAADLLGRLDAEQRGRTLRPFPDDALRRGWHYVPRERPGPLLDELDRPARKAVHRLVASAVPFAVYAQVAAIMALEDVLDESESGGSGRRHRDLYAVLLFGEPGGAAWGWRFEGHHVSLNLTVVDGRVAVTPLFLGANPAAVGAVRPLAQEEERARALLDTLDRPALERAVIADRAPSDITTRAAPAIERPERLGVGPADLDGSAADALEHLTRLYLERSPFLDRDPRDVAFAWAGPLERGRPHYYRLAGDRFLVEYDNTQDGANHIHTVVRDADRDFGTDLLAAHHAAAHR